MCSGVRLFESCWNGLHYLSLNFRSVWFMVRVACGFADKSGINMLEFDDSITGVRGRWSCIGSWSGVGPTFCTSVDAWFIGITTPLPEGLCAHSTFWSLRDCCSWAWRYSWYNASCWATEIAIPCLVYWNCISRWFKLPATLLEFLEDYNKAVSRRRCSVVAEPRREKFNSLAAFKDLPVGIKLT